MRRVLAFVFALVLCECAFAEVNPLDLVVKGSEAKCFINLRLHGDLTSINQRIRGNEDPDIKEFSQERQLSQASTKTRLPVLKQASGKAWMYRAVEKTPFVASTSSQVVDQISMLNTVQVIFLGSAQEDFLTRVRTAFIDNLDFFLNGGIVFERQRPEVAVEDFLNRLQYQITEEVFDDATVIEYQFRSPIFHFSSSRENQHTIDMSPEVSYYLLNALFVNSAEAVIPTQSPKAASGRTRGRPPRERTATGHVEPAVANASGDRSRSQVGLSTGAQESIMRPLGIPNGNMSRPDIEQFHLIKQAIADRLRDPHLRQDLEAARRRWRIREIDIGYRPAESDPHWPRRW
ncbi:MAG: hypothetical protein AAF202_11780, partial [Pseudomonadota bacterium]